MTYTHNGRERHYPDWTQTYSYEDFDRLQALAGDLTEDDLRHGVPGTPSFGYSKANAEKARRIVRASQR